MKEQFWIHKFLSEKDRHRIAETVRQAELKTSGEIVAVIVKKSSATHHVSLVLSLFFFLIFQELQKFFWLAHQEQFLVLTFSALLSVALGLALSRLHFVQRWLTSEAEEVKQVQSRAELEFYRNQVNSTHARTAILIFVSVMERKAVVLADKAIADKLPAHTWQDVVQLLTAELKKGRVADGFLKAIHKSAQLLEEHFPVQAGDKNELANHLIIKE